jgi:ABC-2 type transport system ATP-binding protein
VEGLSFEVEKGEILGFLGPNGAGKTTTMRIVTGFMPATEGTARVDGYDVFDQPIEVKRRIGYLPENPPLYFEMTPLTYLRFVAKLKGVRGARVDEEVKRVMAKVHIEDVKDRIIAKLSKGYKQRVGLAQALLNDPPVLILDEPTIGLDPKQILEVRELIKSLAGEHTIVLSTHILPEVEQTCHRVIIIDKGKIAAVGTPASLRLQAKGAEQVFIEVEGPEAEVLSRLRTTPAVSQVRVVSTENGRSRYEIEGQAHVDIRRDVARAIVNGGWGLLELRATSMSLEDVFIKITTEDTTQNNNTSQL